MKIIRSGDLVVVFQYLQDFSILKYFLTVRKIGTIFIVGPVSEGCVLK